MISLMRREVVISKLVLQHCKASPRSSQVTEMIDKLSGREELHSRSVDLLDDTSNHYLNCYGYIAESISLTFNKFYLLGLVTLYFDGLLMWRRNWDRVSLCKLRLHFESVCDSPCLVSCPTLWQRIAQSDDLKRQSLVVQFTTALWEYLWLAQLLVCPILALTPNVFCVLSCIAHVEEKLGQSLIVQIMTALWECL